MNTPRSQVLRGGSWFNGFTVSFRCADRLSIDPSYRRLNFGFRCVLRPRTPHPAPEGAVSLADRMEAFLLLAAPLIAPNAGPSVAERLARAARLLRLPGHEKTDSVS